MKLYTPTVVSSLSNKRLVELFAHYRMYGTTLGGADHDLCIPGPAMLKEIEHRLLSNGFVDLPGCWKTPFHILLNDQGNSEKDILLRVWQMFLEILHKGLWAPTLGGAYDVFQEVSREFTERDMFDLFEENTVLLTVCGPDTLPSKIFDTRVSQEIFPTPYTGWYFNVLSKEHHPDLGSSPYKRHLG